MDSSGSNLPDRKARGASHEPPCWVESSAVFFVTINCHVRGEAQLTIGDIPARIFSAVEYKVATAQWYPQIFLLMPDHLHMLVSFAWDDGQTMNKVITDWKKYLARSNGISWQRDFFDHRIRSGADHQDKWEYIRDNPVRANLVVSYQQWPHVWFPDRVGWGR